MNGQRKTAGGNRRRERGRGDAFFVVPPSYQPPPKNASERNRLETEIMFNMLVIGSAFVTQANRRLGIPASKTPAELTLPELRKLTAEMQSTARKLYQGEK